MVYFNRANLIIVHACSKFEGYVFIRIVITYVSNEIIEEIQLISLVHKTRREVLTLNSKDGLHYSAYIGMGILDRCYSIEGQA